MHARTRISNIAAVKRTTEESASYIYQLDTTLPAYLVKQYFFKKSNE